MMISKISKAIVDAECTHQRRVPARVVDAEGTYHALQAMTCYSLDL
ncbi:hypothetical protein L195_g057634 [Trifolium pratense]|uniref:Uncharacterized protein n=1 Tax=Trifolium pratense TaxID=57577 RepID=A0A2K3KWM2_TRIPR|nr:hypothetical protein L195_g057634 [Trifolium pratense]